jgi:hypothetical protein
MQAVNYIPAHFTAPLTTLILRENAQKNPAPFIQINLKSILLFVPWCSPINHSDYGSFLYNMGLVTEDEKKHFDIEHHEVVKFIKDDKYAEARHVGSNFL